MIGWEINTGVLFSCWELDNLEFYIDYRGLILKLMLVDYILLGWVVEFWLENTPFP